jgi:hypothetical protein
MHFVERILQRISGWKEKLLSIGGKEILIQAVLQSIPVYAMSVFNITKKFARRLLMPYRSSGGVMMIKVVKCISILGGSFVSQKEKEGWGLEISILST